VKLLELRFYPIERKQDCFKVSVEGSSGEVHHEPPLPFLDSETPDVQDRRFTVVKILESTKFNQKDFSEEEQAWMVREQLLLSEQNAFQPQWLATIGRKLYQVLGQSIQQVIEAAVADAKRLSTWLHIRLRFPADDPKYVRLTDYPWELLHNDYGFLAHQGVTFSRYIAYKSPRPNLPSVERLNVLLISSGAGDDRIGLKSLPSLEREAIAQGLEHAQKQGAIQLEILTPSTLNTLRRRLLERQTAAVPHVLHFDGHGFFGKRCNEAGCRKAYKQSARECECGALLGEAQGYLVFEQSDGTADYVSAQELGELLGNLGRREQPNSEQGIALVVLSSCRSGMSRLSDSVFNGVAQNLIGRGIPAVVAMPYSISVPAASAFAEYFYRSLGQKESLAIALRRGQSAMGIEGNQWYRPVLYLRWEDNDGGQLFDQVVRAMNEEFVNLLAQKEQNLNWKDNNMTATYEYDVFISHASEDKEDFVRPLAEELRKRGYRVWYDEFSLTWGDSLSSSINKGISQSKFGIIVLSHNFFNKKWPESELNGFVSKEAPDRKVILPIWHQVTKKQVSNYYPILADKLAIDSSKGIDYIIRQLVDIMTRNDVPHSKPIDNFPESSPSSNSPQILPRIKSSRQQLRLQEELTDLREEREACNNQYRSAIDEAQRVRLKRKLDDFDNKIDNLERQLNNM
jgi:hypothetical protein